MCSTCGYRFLEDRRPGRTLLAAAAVAALVAAAVIVIPGGDDGRPADAEKGRAPDRPRVPTELLSEHPLSAREAERRLEARFTSPGDDDSAAVRWPSAAPGASRAPRTRSVTATSATRTAPRERSWYYSTRAAVSS